MHWRNDTQGIFVMKGHSIHVDRIANLYSEVMKKAVDLLKEILRSPEGELMELNRWKDNMENDSVDYSVFTEPDNRQDLQDLRFSVYRKLLADTNMCVAVINGNPVWDEDARAAFLKLCLELNRLLMLLV